MSSWRSDWNCERLWVESIESGNSGVNAGVHLCWILTVAMTYLLSWRKHLGLHVMASLSSFSLVGVASFTVLVNKLVFLLLSQLFLSGLPSSLILTLPLCLFSPVLTASIHLFSLFFFLLLLFVSSLPSQFIFASWTIHKTQLYPLSFISSILRLDELPDKMIKYLRLPGTT